MIDSLPTYVLHYKKNDKRRKLLTDILVKEKFSNVEWIVSYDKEEITYQMYHDSFLANHLEHQRRGQDPNEFYPHYPLQPEVVSLAMKYKHLLQKIAQAPYPVSIMLEDDAILCENFKDTFLNYMTSVPQDWDVLFIGQGGGKHIPKEKLIDGVFWYKKDHPADRCTDSIVITKRAAQLLSQHINQYKICFAIDAEFSFWFKVLDMNVYWLEPPIVTQGSQVGLFESFQPARSAYVDTTMTIRNDIKTFME